MPLSIRNGIRALVQSGSPANPPSGQRLLYPKADGWYDRSSAGVETLLGASAGAAANPSNISTADQGPGFAADTYLANSSVSVPQGRVKVGSVYRCRFYASKTAAGTAAFVLTLRVGTTASLTDAARLTLTNNIPQTANIDDGVFEVTGAFRTAGASATIFGVADVGHRLNATGFATVANPVIAGLGTAFDVTGAGLFIGLSVNGGTAAAWTVRLVEAQLTNLT